MKTRNLGKDKTAKVVFRTGRSADKAGMLADQDRSDARTKLAYPENFRSGSETASAVRTAVRHALSFWRVDVVSNSEIALNEVRLAVKRGDLSPEDVAVLWYGGGKPTPIAIAPSGGMEPRPKGFFDALGRQLLELA